MVQLVVLGALATPLASAAAPPRVKTIPSSVVVVTQDFSTPTQPVCDSTAFLQFPDVKGALSYQASWFDTHPRVNTTASYTGAGPQIGEVPLGISDLPPG